MVELWVALPDDFRKNMIDPDYFKEKDVVGKVGEIVGHSPAIVNYFREKNLHRDYFRKKLRDPKSTKIYQISST